MGALFNYRYNDILGIFTSPSIIATYPPSK